MTDIPIPEAALRETAKRLAAYAHGGGHRCAANPCEECLDDAEGFLGAADWWITESSPGSGKTRPGTPPTVTLYATWVGDELERMADQIDTKAGGACDSSILRDRAATLRGGEDG